MCPKAALQISIVIQTGTLGPLQIIGILISFFSLTLGASDLLLRMATKDNKVKQVSWKMTLLVFPAMFFVVVPRILTISLIMAYAKIYNFIFLTAYFALSLGINYPHVRRDPSEVMLGILTNYFAPAIVVEEGSKFYKRSGITASLLHVMCLLILFLLTFGNIINTCFHIETNAGFITYFVLLVLGTKLPSYQVTIVYVFLSDLHEICTLS